MPKVKKNTLTILIITATLVACTTAHVPHPENKTNLKKRHPARPLSPPKSYVAYKSLEQLLYVKAHNDLRKQVHVLPLEWDQNLTASAHEWAVQRSVDCNYRLHSNNSYGENIYWMNYNEFSPSDVVQSWFNEYKFYDHVKNICTCEPERLGCECGHYLNVIWNTTKKVGCSGLVYCDDQKGVLVVCQYDPPGLISGINPFTGGEILEDVLDTLDELINQGNDNDNETHTQINQGNAKLTNQGKDNNTRININRGKDNDTKPVIQGKDNTTQTNINKGKEDATKLTKQGNDTATKLTNQDTLIHINRGKGNNTELISQEKDNDTPTNISRGKGNNTELVNRGKDNSIELANQGKDNDTRTQINQGKNNDTQLINPGKDNDTHTHRLL